jgi:hypothetical protein
VGIDGGYVRAAHKQGWFEVIAGKSVVAFRREDEGEVPLGEVFRVRSNLRRETATAIVGTYERSRSTTFAPLESVNENQSASNWNSP